MEILKELFFQVVRMSLASAAVIAVLCVLRLFLKRAPKRFSYLLWLAAAFRLACPVSFSSVFSLFSLTPAVKSRGGRLVYSGEAAGAATPAPGPAAGVGTNTAAGSAAAAPSGGRVPAGPESLSPAPFSALLPNLGSLFALLWAIGVLALVGYAVCACLRTRRRVAAAVRLYGNVYECDAIRSPFVLGFFRPKIYLPFGLSSAEKDYLLCHESTHIRRGDHLVKPLAFLLLAVHWFNPLVWLAFSLMTKDMEMSCDEAVLQKLGEDIKKPYTLSLLAFAENRRFPSPNPLSFGETGIRERVKNALGFRKGKAEVSAAVAVLCILAIAACAANPPGRSTGAVGVRDSDDAFAVQAKELLTTAFTCPDAIIKKHWAASNLILDIGGPSPEQAAQMGQQLQEAREAEAAIYTHNQARFPAGAFAGQTVQDKFIFGLSAYGLDGACIASGGAITVLDITEEPGVPSVRSFLLKLDVQPGGEKAGTQVEAAVKFQESEGKITSVRFDEEAFSGIRSLLVDPNYDGDGAYHSANERLASLKEYETIFEEQIDALKAGSGPEKEEKLELFKAEYEQIQREIEELQQLLALAGSTQLSSVLPQNEQEAEDAIRRAEDLIEEYQQENSPQFSCGSLPEVYEQSLSAFASPMLDGRDKILLDLTEIPNLTEAERQEVAGALAELWNLEIELIDAKESYGPDYMKKNLGFKDSTVLLLCKDWKETGDGFQFIPMELTGSMDCSSSDPYTVVQSGKSWLVTPGRGTSHYFSN